MACSLGGERGFAVNFLPRGFGLLRGARLSAAVAVQNPDGFYFRKYKSVLRVFFISQKDSPMTDTPSPCPSRSALSPAARALRLQRISARLQGRRQLRRHRGRGGVFARVGPNAVKRHPELTPWRHEELTPPLLAGFRLVRVARRHSLGVERSGTERERRRAARQAGEAAWAGSCAATGFCRSPLRRLARSR